LGHLKIINGTSVDNSLKFTLETSGEDVKNTLETSEEDVKTTLETSGEDVRLIGRSLKWVALLVA
jgi:hypothetical protein